MVASLMLGVSVPPASTAPSTTAAAPSFGYVGCSNTQMSIAGYKQVGGSAFWGASVAYNGGTIHAWASEIDVPGSPYWGAFDSALAATPTDQIWFEGCLKIEEDATAVHAEAEAVIAEIRERAPGATVYFSAINDYVAPHECQIIGLNGPIAMRELRDQLVVEGLVLPGPDMGSLLSIYQTPSTGATNANNQTVQDGCHPNKAGKASLGQILLGFFSAPPAPTFTVTPTDPSGPSVSFEFTDAQPGATFTCALDGAVATACLSPFAVSGLADGGHVLEIRAKTAVSSQPTSFAWTVDATAPPAPILTSTPTDPSGVAVSFEFTDDEAGVSFTCSMDEALPQACTSPIVYELPEGPHTFAVQALDAFANTSDATSFSWTVDASLPPPAPTFTATPSDPSGSSVTFEFTDQQSGVTFTCALDTAVATACTSPHAISGLADGIHTLEVRALDASSNASAPATFSWTVDTAQPPPAPTFTVTPTDPSSPSVTFQFTDQQSGVTFTCALDAAVATACTSPYAVTGLTAGLHTLVVRAVDASSTSSEPATFTWTVDAVAPTVTMITPAADALLSSTAVAASWTGSDDRAVVRYDVWRRIGTAGMPALVQSSTSTAYSMTGAAGTTYCFQVTAFDGVGNSGSGVLRCAAVPFDDGSPAVTYVGAVSHVAATGAFLNTRTHLTGTGQKASLTFTGRKFGVLAFMDSSSGRMNVLVDGVVVETPDLYSRRAQTLFVSVRTVTPGTHTVTLAWTGTKASASTGTTIKLDGIAVIAS